MVRKWNPNSLSALSIAHRRVCANSGGPAADGFEKRRVNTHSLTHARLKHRSTGWAARTSPLYLFCLFVCLRAIVWPRALLIYEERTAGVTQDVPPPPALTCKLITLAWPAAPVCASQCTTPQSCVYYCPLHTTRPLLIHSLSVASLLCFCMCCATDLPDGAPWVAETWVSRAKEWPMTRWGLLELCGWRLICGMRPLSLQPITNFEPARWDCHQAISNIRRTHDQAIIQTPSSNLRNIMIFLYLNVDFQKGRAYFYSS